MGLPRDIALTYSIIWKNIKKYRSSYDSELQEKCFVYCPENLRQSNPLQDDDLYKVYGLS